MEKYNEYKGIEYPRVSSITGQITNPDPLIYWATNEMGKYIEKYFDEEIEISKLVTQAKYQWRTLSKDAMDIGSEVHRLIEVYVKSKIAGKEYDPTKDKGYLDERVQNAFLAFLEWEQEYKVEWVASELKIVSQEHGYMGTLDAVCRIAGKVYIIDFKAASGVYAGHEIQISAYFNGYNEMVINKEPGYENLPKAELFAILRLDKETGLPEWVDYGKKRGGFEKFFYKRIFGFIKLLRYYYFAADRRLKNNPFVIEAKEKRETSLSEGSFFVKRDEL